MTKMESQTFDSLGKQLQPVNVSGSNDFKLPNQEDLIVMFHSGEQRILGKQDLADGFKRKTVLLLIDSAHRAWK